MSSQNTDAIANTVNEIVIFSSKQPGTTRLLIAGCPAHCFLEYRDFRAVAATVKPQAFIIKSDDDNYSHHILRQLRRDPDHSTALVFTVGMIAEKDTGLCDGSLPAASDLLERIEDWQSRMRTIVRKNDDRGPEALLLEYMWLRPSYTLQPQSDWQHSRRYRYPILEALDRSDSDPDTWLHHLAQRDLIEHVALKDRQRECDFCGSAHISFIDVCPNCHDIEVEQHSALHCFTCGFIAPEQQFINGDQRLCPKCGTRLRHIGSDYDRPLETSACAKCQHVFVEGEVVARCSICNHSMSPSALRLRKIYSWRLTSAGRLAAQGISVMGMPSMAPSNIVSLTHFSNNLNWMLKIARENSGLAFGMASLHLRNLETLRNNIGIGRSAILIEEFIARLREILSDIDLITREDEENVFLLLPNCDKRKLVKLEKSIQKIVSQARQDDGSGPEWGWSDIVVNGKDGDAHNAQTLMQCLREGVPHSRDTALVA